MPHATSPSISQEDFVSLLKTVLPVKAKKFWIACSGGMDSNVMLHLFYSAKAHIKNDMEVVYVDHGLNPDSARWGESCRTQCEYYKLMFSLLKIETTRPKEMSLEEKDAYMAIQGEKAALAKRKRVRKMANDSRRANRK